MADSSAEHCSLMQEPTAGTQAPPSLVTPEAAKQVLQQSGVALAEGVELVVGVTGCGGGVDTEEDELEGLGVLLVLGVTGCRGGVDTEADELEGQGVLLVLGVTGAGGGVEDEEAGGGGQ